MKGIFQLACQSKRSGKNGEAMLEVCAGVPEHFSPPLVQQVLVFSLIGGEREFNSLAKKQGIDVLGRIVAFQEPQRDRVRPVSEIVRQEVFMPSRGKGGQIVQEDHL